MKSGRKGIKDYTEDDIKKRVSIKEVLKMKNKQTDSKTQIIDDSLKLVFTMAALIIMLFGCGGSGDGSSTGAGVEGGGGTSNFTLTYTDVSDIANLDFWISWYAENADGSLRGPYDSGGTGTVDLGQDSGMRATITQDSAGTFFYTYMQTPVGHLTYNTDTTSYGNLVVTLQNATLNDEMQLAYAAFDTWWTIDQVPYTFTQSITTNDIIGTDGNANAFVCYRSSSTVDPLVDYGFKRDFHVSEIGSVTLDVNNFDTCVSRSWESDQDLIGDLPYVAAQYKGVMIARVGYSIHDGSGMQGTFGLADQFPADRWYLVTGDIIPDVVAEFDPSAVTTPVTLDLFDRTIDKNSMVVDSVQSTFTVTVPGTDQIDYGILFLNSSSEGIGWWVYFPWDEVSAAGNTGELDLPPLPGYSTLPTFDFVKLELFRFDGTTTADEMVLYYMDRKTNPLPSYATTSEFNNL